MGKSAIDHPCYSALPRVHNLPYMSHKNIKRQFKVSRSLVDHIPLWLWDVCPLDAHHAPGQTPPPGCRPLSWETPPGRHQPWADTHPGQTPNLDRHPLGRHHPSPWTDIPPWTEFFTHTCKNITFPQLLLQAATITRVLPCLTHSFCKVGLMCQIGQKVQGNTLQWGSNALHMGCKFSKLAV